jgi:predicted MPP superfamily phosphohydrolase
MKSRSPSLKKTIILCSIILLILLMNADVGAHSTLVSTITPVSHPGEIIEVACSDPYPTLGQPVYLIITLQGKAEERFKETLTVRDEFSGFTMTNGEMQWTSGSIKEHQRNVTIGKLPRYNQKLLWYPSVVGNHTLHVSTTTSEKNITISVGFDVEGIITPSLGCPVIITKNHTDQVSLTISEERTRTEEQAQVVKVLLCSIDGTSSFELEEHTEQWSTWIPTGEDTIEDDLIVSYDIETVPEGFYNLTVMTATSEFTWPHAVQLIQDEPTEYTVVQLSDIHIGKYSNPVNKKQELIRLFTYVDETIHPAFVILSGDSVDWYNEKSQRNVFEDLQQALLKCNTPVYTVPGNHERYGHSLLFLYSPYTNLTPYHRFLNPLDDYAFQYGGMNFIFLDSGFEYSRWEVQLQIWNTTPEGSGLTNTQMFLLEHRLGDSSLNQIITMHHPAVNDKNDTSLGAVPNTLPSGNDECIAFNRGAFISYCEQNNVSIVLTGHTHENHVFTSQGIEVTNSSVWPLFIQTDAATLSGDNNGGRIIQIQQGEIIGYDYRPFH